MSHIAIINFDLISKSHENPSAKWDEMWIKCDADGPSKHMKIVREKNSSSLLLFLLLMPSNPLWVFSLWSWKNCVAFHFSFPFKSSFWNIKMEVSYLKNTRQCLHSFTSSFSPRFITISTGSCLQLYLTLSFVLGWIWNKSLKICFYCRKVFLSWKLLFPRGFLITVEKRDKNF